MLKIVGRKKEIEVFKQKMNSSSAEFIAVYGRRRVGKTYLIKQFFENQKNIFFEQVGLNEGTLREQLNLFAERLSFTFYRGIKLVPVGSWMDALKQLTLAIEEIPKNKHIVLFFDELPWLASRKSGFLKALEYYWNTSFSYRKKLILIVCGSAASWMLDHLIYAKGGLHNRITVRIPLHPFDLNETEDFLNYRGFKFNRLQILQIYMVTGGIPHYLQALNKNLSSAQNINLLCFQRGGLLFDEFDILFHSLYDEPQIYINFINAIASQTNGISRENLIKAVKISDGGYMNKRLKSLEETGFIRNFLPVGHHRRGVYYRVIDEYSLFYLRWIKPLRKKQPEGMGHQNYWGNLLKKSEWLAWAGYAFEAICFKHLDKIKIAIGIENVNAICSDWRYHSKGKEDSSKGVQIDLVFDRDDDSVTLCEIKYSASSFVMTKAYADKIHQKEAVYREKTKCDKQIFWVLITVKGAVANKYLNKIFSHVITLEQLFCGFKPQMQQTSHTPLVPSTV